MGKVLRACAALTLFLALIPAASFANPNENVVVIGSLGQAVKETKIYQSASPRSRVFSNVKAYQYLVIRPGSVEEWHRVVLRNGQLGYISANDVAVLPYEVTSPAKATGKTASAPAPSPNGVNEMLQYSFNYVGTKYVWGGNSLTNGIDCSGFVQQLFGKIGVELPRTAAQQALVGQKIERLEDLRPGDRLYFWSSSRNMIGHTGIFLGFFPDGGAYFIHSSSSRKGVATDDLRNNTWRRTLVAARR